ncbi:MAG: Unknown protein [uncultured Aureispira sp.]|uniref:DUF1232 domain-containing protein n=1 Tax=uncultured Aureispira sp. TaxID=1331704 RepID=A0A6S6UH63_9BACT|nr:MAG: Unknown protein [uncultured Aureispira sp.]
MIKTIFAKAKKAYSESEASKSTHGTTSDANNSTYDDGKGVSESLFYRIFVKSAYRLLRKPLTVFKLLQQSMTHLEKYDSIREFAEETKERLGTLTRLVRAYLKGEYAGISKKNVALSLAAILYFLSPLDLIPDFLVAGFLDDFALLTWLYNNLKVELEEFISWEEEKTLIRIPIKVSEETKK